MDESVKRNDLQAKRYVGLVRCSSIGQADTSIDDQRRLLDAYARENDMVLVDHVALEGVSGSLPGNRSDISQLIDRKRSRDDFDVLLVQDTSRFTRAGTQHAHRLESELNAAGIEVVYASGAIPAGPVGDLVKSAFAYADQHLAQSISFASARGSMSAILDGRSPHCRRPPYGIDRLYVGPDGSPHHIIRNLPNGTQLKLDPGSRAVIGRFDVNEKSGVPNHYIKQKAERIVLVPGDDRHVEVVRQIFRRRFSDNWGAFRIAEELNDAGVPSPTGKKWNTSVIDQILRNPIYLGRGIANRYSRAIYYMRDEDRPIESKIDKRALYDRKSLPQRTRPESDWHYQEHPQFADLLDPDIKQLAAAKQRAQLDDQASGHSPQPNRDRHRNTSFFLKGILTSRQGNHPMTGITTGKKTSKRRYYRVSRAVTCPDGNRILRRMVPAEPLESLVVEVIRTTLGKLPDLRDRVKQAILAEQRSRQSDERDRKTLETERETIRRKLELIVDDFDPQARALIQPKLAALQGQLRSIEARIARAAAGPDAGTDTEERIEAVLEAIQHLADLLESAPPATLALLLQSLISKLIVDLETRDVELEIALPAHLDSGPIRMCLVDSSACKSGNQTHPDHRLLMAVCRFDWDRNDRCYLHEPVA